MNYPSDYMKRFIVSGPIGAGKSTLINHFITKYKYEGICESFLSDESIGNRLKHLYQLLNNAKKENYNISIDEETFYHNHQIDIRNHFINESKEMATKNQMIFERSLLDCYLFEDAINEWTCGKLAPPKRTVENISNEIPEKIDYILILTLPYSVAQQRIKNRNRYGESYMGETLEKFLHEYYIQNIEKNLKHTHIGCTSKNVN
ncbi:hypothetical protein PV326_001620 [Microctonus aethiopoides]|nr:hypothetical protein PV326_001620 [Microctonus aethiopoides]